MRPDSNDLDSDTSTRQAASKNWSWRFKVSVPPTELPPIDYENFARELKAMRTAVGKQFGPEDLAHLRKMEMWGRVCAFLGWATSWIAPNPISAWLMGMANVARWTMITHHVSHRGYDKVPGVPKRFQSKHYAKGWRRYIDWLDWMHPDAWDHEHNVLHHYHTGEVHDPDLVEHNVWLTRWLPFPLSLLKWPLLGFLMCTWKPLYYAPNTIWALQQHRKIRNQSSSEKARKPLAALGSARRVMFPGERLLLPISPRAWEYYVRCLLPYGIFRFGLLPALFLPLGQGAWMAALVNAILAEVIANVWSFVIIVPNHAGDDMYRFDTPITDQAEFYVRQVVGSVNYPGGTDVKDFLQGFLNYQIEHHLWPDIPMLRYRQLQPQVKALCAKYGVPYIEQSVFKRFAQLWGIMVGSRSMRLTETIPASARKKVASPSTERHEEQALSAAV